MAAVSICSDFGAPLQKKVLHLCTQGRFGHVRLCVSVDCGPPGFSVREGVLQARILEPIGQYWLPYPSRALFPAVLAANPPEYVVLPESLGPKHLHHLRSCNDLVSDHALITWLSCIAHVACHAVITWLSCTTHLADHAMIM